MEQNKVLSIIIPTYNMEKYLRKCLDSLIVSDEKMVKLEVLVINDGSKDSSSQIGHEYESRYPQTFHVIDKENGNYGSCINRGLKEATGKYVKVLDADDYFENDVLCIYMEFLAQSDSDLVISDFDIVNESGNSLSEFTFNLPTDKQFSLKEIPDAMNTTLWHQAITYKRTIFYNLDYKQTEGISYTDDEWVFKPLFVTSNVVYFPQLLYHYLRGREGQTFDPNVLRKTLNHKLVVAKEMIGFYVKYEKSCLPRNLQFVTEKLLKRVQGVYHDHLVLYASIDSNRRIMEFDAYLRKAYPLIYEGLGRSTNKYGCRYIHHWRKCSHSLYTPDLIASRIKIKIDSIVKAGQVKYVAMPSKLKRPK